MTKACRSTRSASPAAPTLASPRCSSELCYHQLHEQFLAVFSLEMLLYMYGLVEVDHRAIQLLIAQRISRDIPDVSDAGARNQLPSPGPRGG